MVVFYFQVVCKDCCRNKFPLKYMKNRRAKVCDYCYTELCKNGMSDFLHKIAFIYYSKYEFKRSGINFLLNLYSYQDHLCVYLFNRCCHSGGGHQQATLCYVPKHSSIQSVEEPQGSDVI